MQRHGSREQCLQNYGSGSILSQARERRGSLKLSVLSLNSLLWSLADFHTPLWSVQVLELKIHVNIHMHT